MLTVALTYVSTLAETIFSCGCNYKTLASSSFQEPLTFLISLLVEENTPKEQRQNSS